MESNFVRIALTKGYFAIIDIEDYPEISRHSWHIKTGGGGNMYACRTSDKMYRMHRQLLNAPKGMDVDHINGNGLDNRRCNLRIATRAQNMQNMKPKNGFKGVAAHKNKWRAEIRANNKRHYLGLFSSPELAAVAYDKAAIFHCGEFARLNFPRENYDAW